MQAVARHFLSGFLRQTVHLPEQLVAQLEQAIVKDLPLGLDFLRAWRGAGFDGRSSKDGCRGGCGVWLAVRLLGFFLFRSHNSIKIWINFSQRPERQITRPVKGAGM